MGYPEYEAAMLCHMNPERLADWQQLTKELPAIREDYAKVPQPTSISVGPTYITAWAAMI